MAHTAIGLYREGVYNSVVRKPSKLQGNIELLQPDATSVIFTEL